MIALRCVDPGTYRDLTKGKVYIVVREEPDYYTVKNNKETLGTYYKTRFNVINDCESCEYRHCNSCLLNKE